MAENPVEPRPLHVTGKPDRYGLAIIGADQQHHDVTVPDLPLRPVLAGRRLDDLLAGKPALRDRVYDLVVEKL